MATSGGSGVALSAKACLSATATSTPLVRTIMMSSRMQSNLRDVRAHTKTLRGHVSGEDEAWGGYKAKATRANAHAPMTRARPAR